MKTPRFGTIFPVLVMLVFLTAAPLMAAAPQELWTTQPPPLPARTMQMPDWVDIAKALKPAVVNVSTKRVEAPNAPTGPEGLPDFFRNFGRPVPHTVRGLGSGFVIGASGYIVTNNHVVEGATEIRVKMSDGREMTGKVIGRDPKTDIALLKVDATGLPVVPVGDSSKLQVGEPVMAIGNPFGLEQTVTTGIVSATGRVIGEGPYDDFIQTDASINPGNSGGPLINRDGQAVGINTAIFSQNGGSVGIGFAIPVNVAKPVLTQLAATGHVTRGWLGVTIQQVTPDLAKSFKLPKASGALVSGVTKNSPAARAGVKDGDVIVEYNHRAVAKADDLPRVVADTPVGSDVPLTVMRNGQQVALNVKVGRLPEEQPVAASTGPSTTDLGAAVQTLTPDVAKELGLDVQHGVLVRGVREDSRAANAGLQEGDVILSVDQKPVKNVEDLRQALLQHPKGSPTLLLVHREKSNIYLTVAAS